MLQQGRQSDLENHDALNTGEQLIRLIANNTSIILFMLDPDGIIRFSIGNLVESLNNARGGEAVGRSVYEVYREKPEIVSNFERSLAGETFSDVLSLGSFVYDTHYSPLRDEQGQICGVIGVATDITEKRRAEEALTQSEALFSALFERAGIGIVLKDMNGRMIRFNPSFRDMLGYTGEELRKFHYNDITHPLDQPASTRLFQELAAGERESYCIEKRYLRKDGGYAWGRMTATPIIGPDGKPQFVIGMVEDITEHKQIEGELKEMHRRLMHSQENERLRLAQELHDGPLQEIIGLVFHAQTLENSLEGSDLEQLVSMQRILEDLAARVRAIAVELRPPTLTQFGLEKAIQSHAEGFQKQHPELKLTLKLSPDRKILEEDLRLALFRIYQESLTNILKHANASRVWVRFFLDNDRAVLEVQDNGKGFELPRRWVSLARGGHLGLIGCEERAQAVGGKLEIETAPGEGALVRAIVPLNGTGAA